MGQTDRQTEGRIAHCFTLRLNGRHTKPTYSDSAVTTRTSQLQNKHHQLLQTDPRDALTHAHRRHSCTNLKVFFTLTPDHPVRCVPVRLCTAPYDAVALHALLCGLIHASS